MQGELTISLTSETLSSGPAEEKATFGLFSMTANERLLTAGQEIDSDELRHGPYVSGYPLAQWLVWNWWRLRWEIGRAPDTDSRRRWDFAHGMATVGEGYSWPNITIFSDGVQSFLESQPSRNPRAVLFRYFGAARREAVRVAALETAIDGFVRNVLDRLDDRNIRDTNLHRLWNDLKTEREDPEIARLRRLEAQLGYDPDEVDEIRLRAHLRDAATLGEAAVGEMAGDAALDGPLRGRMPSARDVSEVARRSGFDANPGEVADLADAAVLPPPGEVQAWRVGEAAARALRDRMDLDGQPVSNPGLSGLAGTTADAISDTLKRSDGVSFVLHRQDGRARVALRSNWETGRRFELARLIGDRVLSRRMNYAGERLFPATRTYSYRQKAQRAFAAEFLSPFAAVDEMLNGDYSEDMQNDAADRFNVSPMTIRTQLVNRGRIGLEEAPDIAGRGAD